MHVREMRAREDFDEILASTLGRLWSEELSQDVRIESANGEHEPFLYHPYFSAFIHRSPSARALAFLRAQMRFTPRPSRLLFQWPLTELLGCAPVARMVGRRGFTVSRAPDRPSDLVILPGNQRIRVLNLATGKSRVALKTGFDPRTIQNEIAIRGSGKDGPFPPIGQRGEWWFEEPVITGFALPRLPPWRSRGQVVTRAFGLLERYHEESATEAGGTTYVAEVGAQCLETGEAVDRELGPPWPMRARAVTQLLEAAEGLDLDTLVHSHGDYQAGNILVASDDDRVFIIDWEHGAMRSPWYDHFVWALGGRSNVGLALRLGAFVASGGLPGRWAARSEDPRWRARASAVFCLENLLWYQRESLTGPYRKLSLGLIQLRHELEQFAALGHCQ